MNEYTFFLKLLSYAAASLDAAAKARQVYESMKASAQQSHALTPEQSAELDAQAEAIFNSPASQQSGR